MTSLVVSKSKPAPLPESIRRARRIVVVDLGFLGDTVQTVPALWELRRHHPDSEIHVVTTPVGAEVLSMAPCVTRAWVHPLGKPSPPWWRHLGLLRDLRRQRFDLSINFSGADRTLFVAALAGARRRITRPCRPYKFWQGWLAGEVVPPPPRSLPIFEQRRQVLAAIGYDLAPPRFDLQAPADAEVPAGIPPGAAHVSASASTPFKEWPIASWAELIRLLLAQGASQVIATGSKEPRERQRLQTLAELVGDARLRIVQDTASIPRLAALLRQCALHVGTDSGVTHLAMALGLPTVSLFREYAGLEEWRPRGQGHHALTMPCDCADSPQPTPECRAAGTALCLSRIPAGAVANAIAEALRAPSDSLAAGEQAR